MSPFRVAGLKPKPLLFLVGVPLALYALVVLVVSSTQRSMLYFPSHAPSFSSLSAWKDGDTVIGYCHESAHPQTLWLMAHGNAGQASQRDYVLPRMSATDSLYVVEYPGYGLRPGSPSKATMNAAVLEAYQRLSATHPGVPIGVIGESIGSGPACALAQATPAPAKLILLVPFDSLASVAAERMPFLPVGLILKDDWDNRAALKDYAGPVDIVGALDDNVIPFAHAKKLSESLPHAHFQAILGGHNDWSRSTLVTIAR